MQARFLHAKPISREEQPSFQCEVLCLRDYQHLQDQIDVIKISKSFSLTLDFRLNQRNREDYHDNGRRPFAWRTVGGKPEQSTIWVQFRSDLPSLLTEGGYDDPRSSTLPELPKINDQMLSRHPAYTQEAVLVRDVLQSFDRQDGKTSRPLSYEHVIDPTNQAFC